MKSIIILTEGGSGIGLGHVARCEALYSEVKAQGYDVQFVVNTPDDSIELLDQLDVQYADWCDISFIKNKIKYHHHLIVDSYLASKDVYDQLVQQAAHCLILDDFNRFDYPEDATVVHLSLEESQAWGHNYSGRDYLILRGPFAESMYKDIKQDVKRVFITLGSAGNQIACELSESLAGEYPHIQFYGLLTANESVYFANQRHIHILDKRGPEEMKEQLMQADLVITAAGQTMFEVIRTQTPFISILTVDNQQINVSSLISSGVMDQVVHIDSMAHYHDVLKQFERLLPFQQRQRLSHKLEGLIDGRGSKRIIQLLINPKHF